MEAAIAHAIAGAAARAQVRRETAGYPATQAASLRLIGEFPELARMGTVRRWVWWARAVAVLARAGWADRAAPGPEPSAPPAPAAAGQVAGR